MIIDCRSIANKLDEEIKKETKTTKYKLSAIIIGDDPGIQSYFNNIKKLCEKLDVYEEIINLPKDVTTEEVQKLLNNVETDGIIIGKPLPKSLNEYEIICAIPPKKDIDCLHPENIGLLFLNKPKFEPCTPLAVMEILRHENIEIKGKNTCIIGRSNIVGKPLAIMLSQKGVDATITLCHTRTKDIKSHTINADIIIVCAGAPEFIKKDMVKEGAIVIDVGINFVNGKIVGDVDFDEVQGKAAKITKVPGGVGIITPRMLIKNLIKAKKLCKN